MGEPPENPSPPLLGLPELRARLDSVDRRVLELLAERMRVVTEVARFKRNERVEIRDYERERQVLDARRTLARELGLDPAPVEAIYRQILNASRDYQASLGASVYEATEAKRIAIIGGAGAMGQLLQRLFRDLGHTVEIADVATELTPEAAAAQADVVVISVPILSTEQVIRRLGPLVRKDALLLDVTSIKSVPLAAMLASTQASVVGTHPMFGPNVHSLQGQRVVVCKGRGDTWHSWLMANLRARGLVVTEADAPQHDRAMALVQVLTHYQTQVFGLALARSGIPLEESRRFTSPAYLMELYVAARHFAQASDLYGPIEMLNPETARVVATFQQAASEVAEILSSRDQARFDAMFREVRDFFGAFAQEATEQSSYLIDHLVERSS
ncbi:MAG TPA: bifunctional chorismate mutase/prephenate dehydrogenase [Polyangiales bacterium]|nr:bifunctional chorismate mutase/prephenate dehydrogenase [Polyangiales bacterium]